MPFDTPRLTDAFATVPATAWAALVAACALQRASRRLGLWAYAALALPGTAAHELAHFALAWLLRAQPRLPRLWPQRTAGGWRLGSVAFVAPWWRAAPIALAPLLLAPAAAYWLVRYVAPAQGLALAGHAWLAGCLLSASLPSRTDWRIAAPGVAAALAVAVAVGVAVHLLR